MRTVDVHAHGVPQALLDEVGADPDRWRIDVSHDERGTLVSVSGGKPTKLRPGMLDVGARLAAMDRQRVDVQLVSPWMDLAGTAVDDDVAVDFARLSNDAMAAALADHADRLLALANLPLQEPMRAAQELRRAVGDLGMVGAEIATRPGGRDLDDPGFEVLWRTAAELDCPILVHPHRSLAGREVSRHFLGNLVGNPAESTIALGHLLFGGVVGRHPEVRFCFVHGGGFAPYQIGRWDHAYAHDARGAAALLDRPPSELLRTMFFDTVVHGEAALRHLLAVVGEEQVVLGSDYPFEMGDPDPVGSLAAVAEPGGALDRHVRGDNASRLLGPHAARLHPDGPR